MRLPSGYQDNDGNGICLGACQSDTCSPYATCSDIGGDTACECGPGYEGDGILCEDIDGCAANPCAEGVACNDIPAPDTGFVCGACPPGYTGSGASCEVDYTDDCNENVNPCGPGGECEDEGVLSFPVAVTRVMKVGQRSMNLVRISTNVRPRLVVLVGNAQPLLSIAFTAPAILDSRAGASMLPATVPRVLKGHPVDQNIDNCVNHQCVNGGVCVDGVNAYSCTCPMGFSGEFCQNDINDCSDDICGPGGSCSDAGANSCYQCICGDGYTGGGSQQPLRCRYQRRLWHRHLRAGRQLLPTLA